MPVIGPLSQTSILALVFGMILLALGLQVAFGGMENFNLDIERVYEFRRETASKLPDIFGYLYSNVASVLVPVALVLSLRFRAYWLAALALVSTVILFGITHHKSALFGPFFVAILYAVFSRIKSPRTLGLAFMAVPALCVAELLYLRFVASYDGAAYITSLIARRVLFVPAMLDGFYVDYFSNAPKYYWSTSRLGAWAVDNPYGVPAPLLIGYEYFSSAEMSANTGIIGSGYSNAGLVGVSIYAVMSGIFLGLLNNLGRRIGHAFVAAVSLTTVFNILTSADLLTAILTHGLLLLLLLLAAFPPELADRRSPQRRL